MKFYNEPAILDGREVVWLLEATTDGKALIKRQPDKCFKLESVELNRITIMPNGDFLLKESTEKIRRAMSHENSKEHEDSGE